MQTAGHNNIFTRAVVHNRLLFPEAGIAPEIVRGDEDALRLVKPTGAGSLGGAIGQPLMDGEPGSLEGATGQPLMDGGRSAR